MKGLITKDFLCCRFCRFSIYLPYSITSEQGFTCSFSIIFPSLNKK